MKKNTFLILLLLAVLLPGGLLLRSHLNSATMPAGSKPPPATPVTVFEVQPQAVFDRIEALGTTLANESAQVTAAVTEKVVAVHFEDGQRVQAGELLITLQQNEERAQRAAALEQLAENQRELKRLETLLKEDVVPQRDYDERLTLLNVTRQRIREIEARISDRTIRAPFDGFLGLRQVSVGALVEPGDLITTIDDLSRIKLDFNVPATYLSVLQPGSSIHAYSAGWGDERFEGTVATIGTRIDPETRSVLIRAIIPNREMRLRPGLLMTVQLLNRQREALMIPEEALVPVQRRHYVLTVGADLTVERKPVIIGQRQPGMVEVTQGLSPGERVIVRGTTRVQPGQKVSIKGGSEPLPAKG
ncbi:MAG: efflux RND transporter periplasmic adaptor subunit [Desulfobacterales bacterium]|nr:efflux RND transporter periplasmic adaptor subunit [Desulfobacterales bacterium]